MTTTINHYMVLPATSPDLIVLFLVLTINITLVKKSLIFLILNLEISYLFLSSLFSLIFYILLGQNVAAMLSIVLFRNNSIVLFLNNTFNKQYNIVFKELFSACFLHVVTSEVAWVSFFFFFSWIFTKYLWFFCMLIRDRE